MRSRSRLQASIMEDLKKIPRTARFKEDSKDSTTRFSLEVSSVHATFVLLPPPHRKGEIGKSKVLKIGEKC